MFSLSIKVPLVEHIMQHTVNIQYIAWKIGHPALVVWPSVQLALLRRPLPSHPLTVHLLAFLCLVGAEEGVEAVSACAEVADDNVNLEVGCGCIIAGI